MDETRNEKDREDEERILNEVRGSSRSCKRSADATDESSLAREDAPADERSSVVDIGESETACSSVQDEAHATTPGRDYRHRDAKEKTPRKKVVAAFRAAGDSFKNRFKKNTLPSKSSKDGISARQPFQGSSSLGTSGRHETVNTEEECGGPNTSQQASIAQHPQTSEIPSGRRINVGELGELVQEDGREAVEMSYWQFVQRMRTAIEKLRQAALEHSRKSAQPSTQDVCGSNEPAQDECNPSSAIKSKIQQDLQPDYTFIADSMECVLSAVIKRRQRTLNSATSTRHAQPEPDGQQPSVVVVPDQSYSEVCKRRRRCRRKSLPPKWRTRLPETSEDSTPEDYEEQRRHARWSRRRRTARVSPIPATQARPQRNAKHYDRTMEPLIEEPPATVDRLPTPQNHLLQLPVQPAGFSPRIRPVLVINSIDLGRSELVLRPLQVHRRPNQFIRVRIPSEESCENLRLEFGQNDGWTTAESMQCLLMPDRGGSQDSMPRGDTSPPADETGQTVGNRNIPPPLEQATYRSSPQAQRDRVIRESDFSSSCRRHGYSPPSNRIIPPPLERADGFAYWSSPRARRDRGSGEHDFPSPYRRLGYAPPASNPPTDYQTHRSRASIVYPGFNSPSLQRVIFRCRSLSMTDVNLYDELNEPSNDPSRIVVSPLLPYSPSPDSEIPPQ